MYDAAEQILIIQNGIGNLQQKERLCSNCQAIKTTKHYCNTPKLSFQIAFQSKIEEKPTPYIWTRTFYVMCIVANLTAVEFYELNCTI